jgi:hypothetical protein
MLTLSNRVHFFAPPAAQAALTQFFTELLGCPAALLPGSSILLVRFPNTSLSVDFTADALDEQQARRGAWLELTTDDPAALEAKVLAAGLPLVAYPTGRFYFQAPGGQVFGIAAPA